MQARRQKTKKLCLALLAACMTVAAQAGGCAHPWRVGYTLYWAGDRETQPSPRAVHGVDHDLIDTLAQRMDCPAIFVTLPLTRVMKQIESGELDINGQKVCTPERARSAWLLPYLRGKNYVLLRRDRSLATTPQDILNAPGAIIGVVRGGIYGAAYDPILAKLKAQGRIDEEADLDTLFNLFRAGRLAGVISTPPTYAALLDPAFLKREIRVVDWAPDEPVYPVCMMLSKRNFTEPQIEAVAKALKAMRSDGTVRQTLNRYLDHATAESLLLPDDVPAIYMPLAGRAAK